MRLLRIAATTLALLGCTVLAAADSQVVGFLAADSGLFPCDNVTREYWFYNSGPDKTVHLAQHNDSTSQSASLSSQSSVRYPNGSFYQYLMSGGYGAAASNITAIAFNPTATWPNGTYLVLASSCYDIPSGTHGRSQVYVWVDTSDI